MFTFFHIISLGTHLTRLNTQIIELDSKGIAPLSLSTRQPWNICCQFHETIFIIVYFSSSNPLDVCGLALFLFSKNFHSTCYFPIPFHLDYSYCKPSLNKIFSCYSWVIEFPKRFLFFFLNTCCFCFLGLKIKVVKMKTMSHFDIFFCHVYTGCFQER